MGGYSVQLTEFDELIGDVSNAADRIAEAAVALSGAQPGGLGSAGIDLAVTALHDRWEDGIRRIGQVSGQIVDALDRSRREYRAVEDATARALAGGPADTGTVAAEGRIGAALGGF